MFWFTADSHLGHARFLKFEVAPRPFKTVEEMDETIIAAWNSVVQKGDLVYHMGDFAFGLDAEQIDKLTSRLNGTIHLILGNHDCRGWKPKDVTGFDKISDLEYIRINGQKIMLCHYAMRSWRGSHVGTWMLYGHSHGRMPPYGKSMDVGVDCNPLWRPYSFDEVKAIMDTREICCPDHRVGGNSGPTTITVSAGYDANDGRDKEKV